MCPEGRSPDNPQGFTLVELVVVVAALAILAAITIPFMLSFVQASQTRGAAQELKALLNHARQLAITQNTSYSVEVQVNSNNLLRFCSGTTTPCPAANIWTGPGTDQNGWFRLASQAQIVNATANPGFTSLGAATTGATIRVQNSQQKTSCLEVVVSGSGRISTQGASQCP